jgi:polyisoprenoid-binding protein YceI
MYKFIVTSVLVFMLALSVSAQNTWETDLAHSNVGFTISHLVIADVPGKFTDFSGSIRTKGVEFTDAQVDVTIKTGSINTNNEKRDGHLRSADFFDAEKYPTITFTSTAFEKTGEETYKITGSLTMHGITRQVVLDAKFKGQIKDPWGNTRAGFKATTSLDRYHYDLKYNSTLEAGGLLIGKTVDIEINLELIRK